MNKSSPGFSPNLGAQIKAHRQNLGLSLAKLAGQTPMSEATLSRVENGLTEITANNLYALAAAMGIRIEQFFAAEFSTSPRGLRSVTRHGQGVLFRSGPFRSHLLSAELSSKQMTPFINETSAQTIEDAGGLNPHPGEEFLMVTDGRLMLHTEHYEPLELDEGDSVYFDGTMPHAYVSATDRPAKFLVITSEPATEKEERQ